jgi:5-methylthioadenosine/S-adenosylhomocysteine deaminase
VTVETAAEPVDLLVDNIGSLITVDGGRRVIDDAAVAVRDGRITHVGKSEDVRRDLDGTPVRERHDARGAVGTPGLIDCHLHSSFQLARGLADEANAQEFLVQRMYPYEAALTAADVELSAALAAREMLRHGTTCFVDPGNIHPQATVAGVAPSGIRAVLARSAFDLAGSNFGAVPDEMLSTPAKAAAQARALIAEFRGELDGRLDVSVSFRGLNNSSDALITALLEVSAEHDTVLQTHACFAQSTHDASITKFGEPEIERLGRLGALGPRTLLAHAGWLEPHEARLIRESGAHASVNPSSSMHNGYGVLTVGQVPEMLADGVIIGLGSDHASSGPVDLVREMFLVCCGYKEVRMLPRLMPPETAVEMATINAATVLGREDDLGSVEVGKLADLVLFDADDPAWLPLHNPVSNLVYSATGSTVSTVFVAGRRVVDGGVLTGVDEQELVARTRSMLPQFSERLDLDPLTSARWPRS